MKLRVRLHCRHNSFGKILWWVNIKGRETFPMEDLFAVRIAAMTLLTTDPRQK